MLFNELESREDCRLLYISYLRRTKNTQELIALFTHLNNPREEIGRAHV